MGIYGLKLLQLEKLVDNWKNSEENNWIGENSTEKRKRENSKGKTGEFEGIKRKCGNSMEQNRDKKNAENSWSKWKCFLKI